MLHVTQAGERRRLVDDGLRLRPRDQLVNGGRIEDVEHRGHRSERSQSRCVLRCSGRPDDVVAAGDERRRQRVVAQTTAAIHSARAASEIKNSHACAPQATAC